MAPSAQSDSSFWDLFCRNWVACLICKRLFAGSWGPISHVFPVDAGEKNHRGPRKSLSYQRCYPISTGQSADSVQRGSSRPFISRTPPNLGRSLGGSLGGSHATGTEEAPYIKGATQSCPKRAARSKRARSSGRAARPKRARSSRRAARPKRPPQPEPRPRATPGRAPAPRAAPPARPPRPRRTASRSRPTSCAFPARRARRRPRPRRACRAA